VVHDVNKIYLGRSRYTNETTVTSEKQSSKRYTGCPRRNGPNFGRVFLMLNYTDITPNTYIQTWVDRLNFSKNGHISLGFWPSLWPTQDSNSGTVYAFPVDEVGAEWNCPLSPPPPPT